MPIVRLHPDTVDEVGFYLERIRECAPEDAALLAAAAGNDLAPQDLRRLYQAVRELGSEGVVRAFRSHAPHWHLFLKKEPPAFSTRWISPHARLYQAKGYPPAEKSLLVLFTGRGQRAFILIGRLLALLPTGRFDVLRLSVEFPTDYPDGVPGFGDDFFDICQHIQTLTASYGGSAALGTSLGGLSALRAAILSDLRVGVSLGGRFTRLESTLRSAVVASAFDPLCCCLGGLVPLLAYYSAENATDALHARRLAAMAQNVRLIGVKGAKSHNVVTQMLGTGLLRPLFEEVLHLSMTTATRSAGGSYFGLAVGGKHGIA